MKKRVNLLAVILFAALCVAVAPAAGVFAQTAQQQICSGAGGTSGATGCSSTGPTLNSVLSAVIQIFAAIIAAVAIIMLIYGGFQLSTGGDDPGKIKTGRTIITYALVGLVVVAMAEFFVQFVLHRVGGV